MDKYFLSNYKMNINKLIRELSERLNVSIQELAFLEEKLDYIIFNSNSLESILNTYFTLLEKEMASIMTLNITPSVQLGIKNNYFTFVSFGGKMGASALFKDVDENTYYSLDSISKILTSVITMMMIRDGKVLFSDNINSYNSNFLMDASIESILKFTAMIQTEKRIDYLSIQETIDILKRCREKVEEKAKYKNYYQYNDIGYMILRLSIPDFLDRLDTVLSVIDNNNLTYKYTDYKDKITGGKLGFEYVTPDPKGQGILFPGHTGLYGNVNGILNLFQKVFYTNDILTSDELELLLRQPYDDPSIYTVDGNRAVSKTNRFMYMAKVSGIYRKPNNICDSNFSKIATCDFSDLTTDRALASIGTCGSWVMGDDLSYQDKFGYYVASILTNPYSYIPVGRYEDSCNKIPNTELSVNQKGMILGYPAKLNDYKEVMAEYGILLELLTEYIKSTELKKELDKKYMVVKQLKRVP